MYQSTFLEQRKVIRVYLGRNREILSFLKICSELNNSACISGIHHFRRQYSLAVSDDAHQRKGTFCSSASRRNNSVTDVCARVTAP